MPDLRYPNDSQFTNKEHLKNLMPRTTKKGFTVSVWSPDKLEDAAGVGEGWKTAINRLKRTLALLAVDPLDAKIQGTKVGSKAIPGWAEVIFRKKLDRKAIADIVEVLEATKKGLHKDTTFRVCDHIFVKNNENDDPCGLVPSVSCNQHEEGAVLSMAGGWWKPKDIYLRRSVAVAKSRVRKRLRAVTIIHEATHKFAGTVDHAPVGLEGTLDKVRDPNKALQNADSLAWFAYQVGRESFLSVQDYEKREKANGVEGF